MIDKIKSLKSQKDATVLKIESLEGKAAGALADVLELEDNNKSSDKARAKREKLLGDIDLNRNRIKRIDDDIKTACGNFLDDEIKRYPTEAEQLKERQEQELYSGGEGLGQCCLVLMSMGVNGGQCARELLDVLKRYKNITMPAISGHGSFLNAAIKNGGNKLLEQKIRHDRCKLVLKNPTTKSHMIDKLTAGVHRNDFDFLEGR